MLSTYAGLSLYGRGMHCIRTFRSARDHICDSGPIYLHSQVVWQAIPSRFVFVNSVMFFTCQNFLITHFSEHIIIVKWHMASLFGYSINCELKFKKPLEASQQAKYYVQVPLGQGRSILPISTSLAGCLVHRFKGAVHNTSIGK